MLKRLLNLIILLAHVDWPYMDDNQREQYRDIFLELYDVVRSLKQKEERLLFPAESGMIKKMGK